MLKIDLIHIYSGDLTFLHLNFSISPSRVISDFLHIYILHASVGDPGFHAFYICQNEGFQKKTD